MRRGNKVDLELTASKIIQDRVPGYSDIFLTSAFSSMMFNTAIHEPTIKKIIEFYSKAENRIRYLKPIDYFTLLYGVVKFDRPKFKEREVLINLMLDVLPTKLSSIDAKAIASLSSTISILNDDLIRPTLVETCQQLFVDNYARLKTNKKLLIIMLMLVGKKGEFVTGISHQVFAGLLALSNDLSLDDIETIMYYFNYCDNSMRNQFHSIIESKVRIGYSTK